MKAILPPVSTNNARNLSPKKETIQRLLLIAASANGPLVTLADVRFYSSRKPSANVVYCSIWICRSYETGGWLTGHGKAGGYGYHKPSAALAAALVSAGVTLTSLDGSPADISGVGEMAMVEALEAIGVALGYPDAQVF